jgi:hypothetical protein
MEAEKMLTTARVSKHISSLPKGKLFSTKELLTYGTRAAVDQCLYRLVKARKVIRLASGVFMRQDFDITPSLAQTLVISKAKAFCKRIIESESESLLALAAASSCARKKFTYAVKGRSGSLTYGGTTIYLKDALS